MVRAGALARGAVDEDLRAFALELYSAQGGCCALSGLPFSLRVVGGGKARRPYAPSLDRVEAASGYTRDNVRLVCQAVNFPLNAYGEDVFREIAMATARFVPERIEPLAATTPSRDEERDRKSAYIDHVIKEAPRILAAHDGRLDKGCDAKRAALQLRGGVALGAGQRLRLRVQAADGSWRDRAGEQDRPLCLGRHAR